MMADCDAHQLDTMRAGGGRGENRETEDAVTEGGDKKHVQCSQRGALLGGVAVEHR